MKKEPIFGAKPFGARDAKILLISYFDPKGISTIPESVHAWQSHSRHEIVLLNLWPGRCGRLVLPLSLSLSDFDAIIIHPTVSYSSDALSGIDAGLEVDLSRFDGVKILMKQDEHVQSGKLAPMVRDKGFDIVFTCLPPGEWEKVYPKATTGDIEIIQTLTGYVTPQMRAGLPDLTRDIDVSYRGSIQHLSCGRLGYEKRAIGYDVAEKLADSSLVHAISSRWEDRISGRHWDMFLARSKIVLGVESGSNIFDFDGEVSRLCSAYEATHGTGDQGSREYYFRAHEQFLHRFEGNVDYAQISPRHFEAAAAGAAQLLYEGRYSGIFRPQDHFFALRKDLSNWEEAMEFLRDDRAQKEMATRSFEEIILNPGHWYESFVARADDAIDAHFARKGRKRSASTASKPLAYVLAAHEPTIDPRVNWLASSLKETHDVVVIGTYRFNEVGERPTVERTEDGTLRVRVERTLHDASWMPTQGHLLRDLGTARPLLAALASYVSAPDAVIAERLGADIGVDSELGRFRELCCYMVDTSAALISAVEKLGVPDVLVSVDLEALFAGAAIAEDYGVPLVFDAHEWWPHSVPDFQHWEIEFWETMEGRLSAVADLRLTVTPQIAERMGSEYGVTFETVPNAAMRAEGEGLALEEAFARREVDGPLVVLFQGGFAAGRGIEESIRAVALTQNVRLILRGPDNGYRRSMMDLAKSLDLDEDRVSFPPAVREDELVTAALQADVGLIPYNPAYFGYRYCCPNKLSQYTAAGLPILCSETEFVAGQVRGADIGWVVPISDAATVAAVLDELATRRQDLVRIGRRARAYFEQTLHWEAVFREVCDAISRMPQRPHRTCPDTSWIERSRGTNSRYAPKVAPARIFGARAPAARDVARAPAARDVARAAEGASVVASSLFCPRPNDADLLLRDDEGYAAGIHDASSLNWIEIDLGAVRVADAVVMTFYDENNYATALRLFCKVHKDDRWGVLADFENRHGQVEMHRFRPREMRYLLLEATAYHGQQRLLMRGLKVLEADPCVVAAEVGEAPAVDRFEVRVPINFASSAAGASISAASLFCPAPNDAAACLLSDGYAAAAPEAPGPHWIEIDLGTLRPVATIHLQWYDTDNYPTRYTVEARVDAGTEWVPLIKVRDNASLTSSHRIEASSFRYVRVTTLRYNGQARMLLRAIRMLAPENPEAAAPLRKPPRTSAIVRALCRVLR